MSHFRRRGAGVALANREQYIRLLQEALPNRGGGFTIGRGSLQGVARRRLDDAVRSGDLDLPADWQPAASRALHLALADIVPQSAVEQNDYFLCSLIHPTFIEAPSPGAKLSKRTADLRRSVAMPLEVSLCGAAALQMLSEVLRVHNASRDAWEWRRRDDDKTDRTHVSSHKRPAASRTTEEKDETVSGSLPPSLDAAQLAQMPRLAGISRFILFNAAFFPTNTAEEEGVPEEVLVSSMTSLCGAIDLCSGSRAVALFLDRMLPRVTGGADKE